VIGKAVLNWYNTPAKQCLRTSIRAVVQRAYICVPSSVTCVFTKLGEISAVYACLAEQDFVNKNEVVFSPSFL
jgi:hypothetical protein